MKYYKKRISLLAACLCIICILPTTILSQDKKKTDDKKKEKPTKNEEINVKSTKKVIVKVKKNKKKKDDGISTRKKVLYFAKLVKWTTNISIGQSYHLIENSYQIKEKKTTVTNLSIHYTTPYSHKWHFGLRINDILYLYYQGSEPSYYHLIAPELTFGRNLMIFSFLGIKPYIGIGYWIGLFRYTGEKNFTSNPGSSVGIQFPIALYKSYLTPYVEYSFSSVKGFEKMLMVGVGVSY